MASIDIVAEIIFVQCSVCMITMALLPYLICNSMELFRCFMITMGHFTLLSCSLSFCITWNCVILSKIKKYETVKNITGGLQMDLICNSVLSTFSILPFSW